MITHRVPIDDMYVSLQAISLMITDTTYRAKLYAAFDKRIAGVEKVFVETRFSNPPSQGCPTVSRVDDWETATH
ncbi:hypothetical protein AG1IA_07066 [Rhizoctonia solani AG-1 IA]|uniref:Uncharacterized protein n=1 Tax=Thanatephorus cucumeris (strain AG1-IA) TaxID=983506 RepID=L8WQ61_THACA|nr:hypothetical protein AG1IA_07066 [Rhizoctonia solani AG-1 IA]